MHSLETKLAVIKGAIRAGRRMSFFYNEAYRELFPHLLVIRDGQWRLFGVQIGSASSDAMLTAPEWECFEVDDISGEITVFARNEPVPGSALHLDV